MQIRNASIQELYPIFLQLLEKQNVKIIIKGNSMYPLLRSNIDSVVLTKPGKIKKYDLLFYKRNNGEFVVHRVVAKKNNAFCMAGDFEIKTEYPVYPHQVIAVIKSFYRKKHHISCNNLLYKVYGFLWVLLLPKRHIMVAVLKKIRRTAVNKRWKPL